MVGSGGFGDVYRVLATSGDLQGREFAMKTETVDGEKRLLRLKIEVEVLEEIKKAEQARKQHLAEIVDKGLVPGKFKYVVMTLVGPSLDEVRKKMLSNCDFSPGTAAHIAKQTLQSIWDLHQIGYIHRFAFFSI